MVNNSLTTLIYPAIILGVLLLKPRSIIISIISGFNSYIRSTISIVSFLVLALPLIKPPSIAFFDSSYPQDRPFCIQTLKHCKLFYIFAGVVSFNNEGNDAYSMSGLFGSSVRRARRS